MTGHVTIAVISLIGVFLPGLSFADDAIALMYEVRPPYIVEDASGEISGLTATPSVTAFRQAGLDFKAIAIPTNRQLASIKNDKTPACGIGWFDRPERRAFAHFTEPVYRDRPTVVLMRRQTAMALKHETLEGMIADDSLSLLVKTRFSYGPKIDSWIAAYEPDTTAVTLDNVGMVRMIEANRADFMLLAADEATYLTTELGKARTDALTIVAMPDSPHGNYRHLMCSFSVPVDAIERLNRVIETFKLP